MKRGGVATRTTFRDAMNEGAAVERDLRFFGVAAAHVWCHHFKMFCPIGVFPKLAEERGVLQKVPLLIGVLGFVFTQYNYFIPRFDIHTYVAHENSHGDRWDLPTNRSCSTDTAAFSGTVSRWLASSASPPP